MVGFMAGVAGGATVAIVIKAIDEFSGVMKGLDTKTLAIGGALTAVGIAGLSVSKKFVKLAGEFEQTQIAFTTMLGSAEEAQKLLQELADFASRTPFTITGVEKNAKQLLAMGIETEELLPTLKSLGDVSAGLNVPLDRLALNFGQVRVQGKLTGRELRDFSVAGVPLVAELAKNLGIAESAIADMVSKGEIGFPEVEAAFTTMTSEGGKFFDLMDKQSQTFLGQVSNMQDEAIKLGRDMGEILLPAAKRIVEVLGNVVGWFKEHPQVAKFAIAVVAVASGLALIAGPILLIKAVLPVLIAGFTALSSSIMPLALVLGAVLAIAIAIFGIIQLIIKLLNFIPGINIPTATLGDVGKGIKRLSGDIMGTNDLETQERASYRTGLFKGEQYQSGPTTVNNFNIEKVQGLDSEDISQALANETVRRIRPA